MSRLGRIWAQEVIPVVLRRTGKSELLRLRLPYAPGNGEWLRNGRTRKPSWNSKEAYWEIPKAWFNDFVDRALKRFGKLYVIQPFRAQEECAPACQNAQGHECQCSCMGANHGQGDDGTWFEVSDTFSTRWQDRELASRLMVRRS